MKPWSLASAYFLIPLPPREDGCKPDKKDTYMATEAKSKPNLLLIAAIAGVLLILSGQGIIKVDPKPEPNPTPVVKPEPVPTPVPTPTPTPVPSPDPKPIPPNPEPEPPIVEEEFPDLPQAYAAISAPINSSLFKKETAEDALIYSRFFRDGATVVRNDPTITSNSHYIKVYNEALKSLVAANPDLVKRNHGLGKAIDDVLATQGLDITNWTEANRKSAAEAMDAISYRCLESYRTLMGYPPMQEEITIIKDKVAYVWN